MKLSTVAAIVAVAALSVAASAQGRPPMGGPGGPGGPGGGRMRMTPQEQADRTTQMLTQALGLSPAQAAKVKAIVLKNALEIKKIRDGQEAQIKKVLTPDQLKKMSSMPRGGFGGPGGPGGGRGRGPGGRPGGR